MSKHVKGGGAQPRTGWWRAVMDPVNVYFIVSIAGLAAVILCFLFSHGDLISRYFFNDTRDTGMDFFHSIEYINGYAPYETFNTLYPPLANLLFSVLLQFVPIDLIAQWPSSFSESVSMRGSALDLRTFQAPMLLFVMYTVTCAVAVVVLVQQVLKSQPVGKSTAVACCMLTSYGVVYAFERGNILLLSLALCFVFVIYRNSSSPFVREAALICLAVSSCLKLYPAFFGFLLLKDRQFGRALRAAAYGVALTVVPVLFFKEGLSALEMWVRVTLGFGTGSSQPWVGLGFSSILHRLALYLRDWFGIVIPSDWFPIASLAATVVLLACSLVMKKEWESVLAMTIAILVFHSQAIYILAFFILPLALFLAQERKLTKRNLVPYAIMILFVIPLPLFYIRYVHYPRIGLTQILLLLSIIWVAYSAIKQLRSPSRRIV